MRGEVRRESAGSAATIRLEAFDEGIERARSETRLGRRLVRGHARSPTHGRHAGAHQRRARLLCSLLDGNSADGALQGRASIAVAPLSTTPRFRRAADRDRRRVCRSTITSDGRSKASVTSSRRRAPFGDRAQSIERRIDAQPGRAVAQDDREQRRCSDHHASVGPDGSRKSRQRERARRFRGRAAPGALPAPGSAWQCHRRTCSRQSASPSCSRLGKSTTSNPRNVAAVVHIPSSMLAAGAEIAANGGLRRCRSPSSASRCVTYSRTTPSTPSPNSMADAPAAAADSVAPA